MRAERHVTQALDVERRVPTTTVHVPRRRGDSPLALKAPQPIGAHAKLPSHLRYSHRVSPLCSGFSSHPKETSRHLQGHN